MTQGNWGRWGSEDERGALNWINSERILAAARLTRKGRVYPLAVPLDRATAAAPGRQCPIHFMNRDGGDYAFRKPVPGAFQFADDTVLLATHVGTHMDALAHCWTDDQMYNGYPSSSVRSTSGARYCGIDKVGALVGRGVLLDVAAYLGVPHMEAAQEISAETLSSCASSTAVVVGEGDVVLIRTGWQNIAAEKGDDYFLGEPGLGIEGARWLTDRHVSAVGADNYALEFLPPPEGTFAPVHLHLIRDHGTPILECMMLEELARDRVTEFLFVAAPLPITGGVGSPLTPIAIA